MVGGGGGLLRMGDHRLPKTVMSGELKNVGRNDELRGRGPWYSTAFERGAGLWSLG